MNNSILMKFSLLSISLILTSAYSISAGIPLMVKDFPECSQSSIELLSTIPAFSVIVMVLCSSYICRKFGKKRTVQTGLIISFFFGVIPCFNSNYEVILFSRIMLGVGFGLVNALAVSLIGDFYQGNQKATIMGLRGAFEAFGQSIMTFVAANLLYYGWNFSFIVYAIALPILILFTFFVPKIDEENERKDEISFDGKKINIETIILSLFLFFFVVFYIAIFVRFSEYFSYKTSGDAVMAGNILGLVTFGGMASGVLFGLIYSFMKGKTVLLGVVMMSVGFIILANTGTSLSLAIGVVVIGISFPVTVAYVFNLVSVISPKGSEVLVASFMLVGCNLGALLAPYGLKISGEIFGNTEYIFNAYGWGILFIGVAVYFYINRINVINNR